MSGEERVSACREVGCDDCRVKVDAESRRAGAGGRDFRRRVFDIDNAIEDRQLDICLTARRDEYRHVPRFDAAQNWSDEDEGKGHPLPNGGWNR
jgi:hypothetical protein